MNCLCISEINSLVALFAHIFSFHFVSGFLCCAELLSLVRFHFFIFAFISFPWETDLRKHCYDLCQNVLPMLLFLEFCGIMSYV